MTGKFLAKVPRECSHEPTQQQEKKKCLFVLTLTRQVCLQGHKSDKYLETLKNLNAITNAKS